MGIGWYKSIKKILKEEPELWLSYIHGQQLENVTHLTGIKPRYRGLPLQLMKFSYLLIKTWRPFSSNDIDNSAQYFFFAGTSNQMDSLDPTIDALREKGAVVTAIAFKDLLNRQERKERYIPLTFSTIDILKTVLLVTVRGPFLYKELKKLHPEAVSWWFSNFCLVYVYLVYFQRVLPQIQPRFVITANDHNVPNRCMLAVAHQLGIETVYLQHASVSNVFPALRVSYAFLDGQCGLDIYRQCEKNQPNTNRKVPIPEVFLSGQKKPIIKNSKEGIESIGVALNSLDDIDSAIGFISQLSDLGCSTVIRWHPGQAEHDIKKIRNLFEADSVVALSDPKQEPVSDFLSCINWLVAGNSSIHLEAALAGVQPFYYELTLASTSDYYGYVKNGLAIKVNSVDELNTLMRDELNTPNLKDSIRYYSSTYQTEWEGQEGRIVATTLCSIVEGARVPIDPIDLF